MYRRNQPRSPVKENLNFLHRTKGKNGTFSSWFGQQLHIGFNAHGYAAHNSCIKLPPQNIYKSSKASRGLYNGSSLEQALSASPLALFVCHTYKIKGLAGIMISSRTSSFCPPLGDNIYIHHLGYIADGGLNIKQQLMLCLGPGFLCRLPSPGQIRINNEGHAPRESDLHQEFASSKGRLVPLA